MTQITQTTTGGARALLIEPGALVLWLLSILTCLALAMLFDPIMLTTDTAQHISVARNIAAGHGIATDLLYFEQQQAFGSMPAPQTVWPPLFALLTALVALFMDETRAVFWVATMAHAGIAPLLYTVARVAGFGQRTALAAGLSYLAFGTSSMLVLGGLTESLFTLLSVCSLLAFMLAELRTGGARMRALLLAGVAAALAYLTRYSGLCLVAALGVIVGLRWLRAPRWSELRDALLVASLPAMVVALMLIRNYLLTGSASGGPAVSLQQSVLETARTYYWSAAKLFGFDSASGPQLLVLPAVLVLALAALWRFGFAFTSHAALNAAPQPSEPARRCGLALAAAYAGFSLLLITVLAVARYPEFINDRYLVPLWPFAIVVFIFLLPAGTLFLPPRLRRLSVPVFVAVAAALLLGQGAVVARELTWFGEDRRIPTISAALSEPLASPVDGARTVGELLEHAASAEAPLIETNGQYLGMLLRRPVVGMGETRFTKRIWDEAAVREIVQRFNVRVLVFFPTLFDPTAIENRNRVLSSQLHRGSVPPWLEPLHVSPRVQVYRIKP